MANQKIIIRGKVVNGNTIKAFASSKAKALEALGDWANAAAANAVINGDPAWLNGLMKACLTASGNPSADSKRVVSYIKAHTKGLQYTTADGWSISKKEERRQLTEVLADKQTFKLTLAQFEAIEKESAEPKAPKPLTAKQLGSRISGLMEALQNGLKADPVEAVVLSDAALELFKALDSAITKAGGLAATLDVDKAAQLASVKPTAASKAAPKAKAKAGK